jgi:hypothetical protein
MLRPLAKIFGLTFLLLIASVGVVYYQHSVSNEKKIEKLQDEKRQLEQVVTRLEHEKRVADVLVSRQQKNDAGVLETTLLFVEYDKSGNSLPAKSFTIQGNTAHIDAMVIKFDHEYVAQSDALKGHSIALFTKIYGDNQSPADGATIDTPGVIPDIYRGADPVVTEFETNLWKDFWMLYDDETYRQSKGVRALGGHGLWGPFLPDKLYTITIESDGGLNMTSEPLKGIYRAAMNQSATTKPTTAPVTR